MNIEDIVMPRRRALQIIGAVPCLLSMSGCPDSDTRGQETDEQVTPFPQALQIVDSVKEKIRRRLEHDLSPFTSGREESDFYEREIAPEVREIEGLYGELSENRKEEFRQFMREQKWVIFDEHQSNRYAQLFDGIEWDSRGGRYRLAVRPEFLIRSELELLEAYAIACRRYHHLEGLEDRKLFEVVASLQTGGNVHIPRSGQHYVYVDHGKNEDGHSIYTLWSFAPPGWLFEASHITRHTVASRGVLLYTRFKEGFAVLHGREPNSEDIKCLELTTGDGTVSGTEVVRRYEQNPMGCETIQEFIISNAMAVDLGPYWKMGLGDGRRERNER